MIVTAVWEYWYSLFILRFKLSEMLRFDPEWVIVPLPDDMTIVWLCLWLVFTLFFLDFWVNVCLYFTHYGMEQTKTQWCLCVYIVIFCQNSLGSNIRLLLGALLFHLDHHILSSLRPTKFLWWFGQIIDNNFGNFPLYANFKGDGNSLVLRGKRCSWTLVFWVL